MLNQELFKRGLVSGLIGTVVLSGVMAIKTSIGLIPALDPIGMLSQMLETTLGTGSRSLGWVIHFAIGTIFWGLGFAAFNDQIPGKSQLYKGIWFASAAWFAMMLVLLPLTGAGLFGVGLDPLTPVVTLVMHQVFGLTLGFSYTRICFKKQPSTWVLG